MVIDQRNAGASVSTPTANAWTYFLDRWAYYCSSTGKYSVQQNAGAVTPPAGFTNYLGVTSLAATALGATDVYDIKQPIEGYNIADLGWGTSNAKTITLSFWVRSSLTGAFGGSLSNGDFNRLYPFTYTISAANTWTLISITIPGDTTGNWYANNNIGINVVFGLGIGSTYGSGTAGAWGTSGVVPTGSTSVVSTSGATFYITGVQLEVGTQATTFDYRSYGTELALCQRYYFKIGANTAGQSGYQAFGAGSMQAGNTSANIFLPFKQTMRATPTITYSGNVGITSQGSYVNIVTLGSGYGGVDSSLVQPGCAAVGQAGYGAVLIANADAQAFIAMSSEL